jgi:hypothetical protein
VANTLYLLHFYSPAHVMLKQLHVLSQVERYNKLTWATSDSVNGRGGGNHTNTVQVDNNNDQTQVGITSSAGVVADNDANIGGLASTAAISTVPVLGLYDRGFRAHFINPYIGGRDHFPDVVHGASTVERDMFLPDQAYIENPSSGVGRNVIHIMHESSTVTLDRQYLSSLICRNLCRSSTQVPSWRAPLYPSSKLSA